MRRIATCAAALLAVQIASPVMAKSLCYSAQEIRAMQLRQAQIELMVGALQCQDPELGFRSKYSAFVSRFDSTIKGNAQELRAMFNRLGKGERGMDRYITDLSNDASNRVHHVEDYCGDIDAMYQKVLTLKPAELSAWAAETIAKPTAAVSCSSPERTKPVQQAKAAAEPQKAKASKTDKVEKKKADNKS